MKPSNFDINEIISTLQGTCMTLDEALPEGMSVDDLTQEDHDAIDNEIFLCVECGWWMELCDDGGDGICTDCQPEDEDDY